MQKKRVVCKSCGKKFKSLAKHARFCELKESPDVAKDMLRMAMHLQENPVVSPEEKAIDVLILYCAEQAEALATISSNLLELKKHVGGGNIEKVWHAEAVPAG
jgi:hypothetical protein